MKVEAHCIDVLGCVVLLSGCHPVSGSLMEDLQITEAEAEALRITAEQWGCRESRCSAHTMNSCAPSWSLRSPMGR